MSVENFIAELKERQLISDRLEIKLRETLASADRPLSARAVANLLVRKKHLSQRHATETLDALSARGDNIDDIRVGIQRQGQGADATQRATPGASPVAPEATVVSRSKTKPVAPPSSDDEDPESSSIFAPYLTGRRNQAGAPPPTTSPTHDELELVPDDEPVDPLAAAKPAPRHPVETRSTPGASTTPVDENREVVAVPHAPDVDRQSPDSAPAPTAIVIETADADRVVRRANRRPKSAKSRTERAGRSRNVKRKNEWDSPLILVGGGLLLLLVLAGLATWWLLNSETGDEKLRLAKEARDSGSYSQAIELYTRFLTDHPNHASASAARVELAMTRIRRDVEADRFSVALQTASDEIEAVEGETQFPDSHAELASLLPAIAAGLAAEAEKTQNAPDAERFVSQATQALEMCNVTKYIPKRLRDDAQLDGVRQILLRVEQRQATQNELQATVRQIEAALAAGDTKSAYHAHRQIIKQHPELEQSETLSALVRKIASLEQSSIRFVPDEQQAENADHPTPWVAALAIAHRHDANSAAAAVGSAGAVCVRVDGALYGFDVATGKLLWRRHAGFDGASWPAMSGESVLVRDTNRNELLRLDAGTGKLVWRQPVGEPFAAPIVVNDRVYLAANSGRLYVIEVETGKRTGYVQFGQSLSVPPMPDRLGERLYLAGDQYNLYAVSLSDLACLGVYYLGHAKGSIQVAPVPILDKLAVIVNDGVETSHFHLLALDERGAIDAAKKSERLAGLAAAPPLVSGRRLVLATDRGQISAYEIASGDAADAITLVATREASDRQPVTRHLLAIDNKIWMGDTRLTKFGISPAGNRLPVEPIDNNFIGAVFDHPLQLFGKIVVHVHRPSGRSGAVVAAMNIDDGRTLWQTEVASAPSWAPIVDEAQRSLTMATANGQVYRFDEGAIKARVLDQPLAPQGATPADPTLSYGADLGAGRAAFCRPGVSNQIALVDPADGARVRWVTLPSKLACEITPFADGLLAPLSVGQVFYLRASDGQSAAAAFQPRLEPNTEVLFKPAGVVGEDGRQFVIADGRDKIYLVALGEQPPASLNLTSEAKVGQFPLASRALVIGDTVLAAHEESGIVRFALPSLSPAGELDLPGVVAWGPYRVGELIIVATADAKLLGVSANGEIVWNVSLQGGDLAGPPLAVADGFLLAYRSGLCERRSLQDGAVQGQIDVEHPLAAGPVRFLDRIVLTTGDSTLLVIESP